MTAEEHARTVEESKETRRRFREANHPCPACCEPTLTPMGGPGNCWIECKCGVFSPMSKSYEEALADVENWQEVEPELNARMHPPVGG